MTRARLGVPLFVVVARTAQARATLSAPRLAALVSRWAADAAPEDWFVDHAGGVAFFRPSARYDSASKAGESCILLRGHLRVESDATSPSLERLGIDLSHHPEAVLRAARGDFVLAHWDGDRHRLILARDHLGRRSLFYRVTDDLILLCSEPGPLYRREGEDTAVVDRRSLFWFLAFGGPLPGCTLVDEVAQLRAGHFLSWFCGDAVHEVRYWSPLGGERLDIEDAASEAAVVAQLETAIVNEVDLGSGYALSLSGGTDSSLLLALATANDRRPRFAVNVRFEAGLDDNEDEYAAFAAHSFGVPLKRVTLERYEALELFEKVVGVLPEPCAAWAALSHAAVLQAVRQENCDRLCSGFGADEIFGGYDHFRIGAGASIRAARRIGAPPGRPLHLAASLDPSGLGSKAFFPGVARFFDDAALRRHLHMPYSRWRQTLWQRSFYEEAYRIAPNAEPVQTMVAHECQNRIPDIVLKSFEPLGRRYGVGSAYPFLDPDLCRTAAALSLTDRYRTAAGIFSLDRTRLLPGYKWALTKLAGTRVPAAIIARARKSYTAPFALWMRDTRFSARILEMIADSRLWDLGMVKRSALDAVVTELEAGPGPNAHKLWCLLVLARWCDTHRIS